MLDARVKAISELILMYAKFYQSAKEYINAHTFSERRAKYRNGAASIFPFPVHRSVRKALLLLPPLISNPVCNFLASVGMFLWRVKGTVCHAHKPNNAECV